MTRPVRDRLRRLLVLVAALPFLAACGGPGPGDPSEPITVFAAASLTDVLPEIASAWRADGGGEVRFSFAATSKLVPQIREGAPADVLVSADEAWMDALAAAGKVEEGTRTLLARNELVFVVPAGAADPPASASALPGALRRIALADQNVPAGKYAKAALQRAGRWDAVAPLVVPGEDVRMTLRWVSSGEADGGVVYRTDARSDARVSVAFAFAPQTHPPVVYPAAAVRGARHLAAARRFLAFCRGEQAQALLAARGFLPPGP